MRLELLTGTSTPCAWRKGRVTHEQNSMAAPPCRDVGSTLYGFDAKRSGEPIPWSLANPDARFSTARLQFSQNRRRGNGTVYLCRGKGSERNSHHLLLDSLTVTNLPALIRAHMSERIFICGYFHLKFEAPAHPSRLVAMRRSLERSLSCASF
jgi:hypothetical protein